MVARITPGAPVSSVSLTATVAPPGPLAACPELRNPGLVGRAAGALLLGLPRIRRSGSRGPLNPPRPAHRGPAGHSRPHPPRRRRPAPRRTRPCHRNGTIPSPRAVWRAPPGERLLGARIDGSPLTVLLLGVHGVVIGTSGAGKATTLRTRTDAVAACAAALVWDLDPAGGSLDVLGPGVGRRGDPAGITAARIRSQALAAIEIGQSTPGPVVIDALAHALGCPPAELHITGDPATTVATGMSSAPRCHRWPAARSPPWPPCCAASARASSTMSLSRVRQKTVRPS